MPVLVIVGERDTDDMPDASPARRPTRGFQPAAARIRRVGRQHTRRVGVELSWREGCPTPTVQAGACSCSTKAAVSAVEPSGRSLLSWTNTSSGRNASWSEAPLLL